MKLKIFLHLIVIFAITIFCVSAQNIQPTSLYNNFKHKIGFDLNKNIRPKIFSTIPTVANSSTNRVIDGNDVRVFPSGTQQSEVHISINRNNPNNLITSCNSISIGSLFTTFDQGEYYTTDGGLNWSGSDFLPNNPGLLIGGDPSTSFNSSSRGIVSTMYGGSSCAGGTAIGYATQSTTNQGVNWSTLAIASSNNCFDKSMIATDDEPTSPFVNNIYCSWTNFSGNTQIQFNRSTNNGISYSTPITIGNSFEQGSNVQTGPNGEVYVCWASYNINEVAASGLGFCRSTNGGVTFTNASRVFQYAGFQVNGANPLFNSSRVNDFPSMAVDKTHGVHRGRIYVAFPERENGNGKVIIRCRFSDDNGTNWSNPTTVSISKWQAKLVSLDMC